MRVKWKASQPQVKRPRLEIMDAGENVVSDHELTFFYCELYGARLPLSSWQAHQLPVPTKISLH